MDPYALDEVKAGVRLILIKNLVLRMSFAFKGHCNSLKDSRNPGWFVKLLSRATIQLLLHPFGIFKCDFMSTKPNFFEMFSFAVINISKAFTPYNVNTRKTKSLIYL